MTAPANKRAAAKPAGENVRPHDVELAEERGEARVRDQLRAAVAENRRVVRVGDLQVEVVETAALDEILEGR